MGWENPSLEREYFRKMPKIELHRHLEGSLRFETLVELAQNDENIISDLDVFRKTVQIGTNDPLTYENFLSKFQPFRKILKSPDVIPRIVYEAVEDAAKENILYLELRFTPLALCINGKYGPEDVIKWVAESTQEASKKFGIKTRLILSINRHESVEIAERIGKLAVQFQDQGIVAIDLAGDESNFSALPFLPVFAQLKKQGLFITIHAGEWNSAENVLEAIELFNANRIGHGVRVLENTTITELARNCAIPFEICITSNFHSGVVGSLKSHPIKKMLNSDLNITINSDDPGISQTTLSDEFYLLRNHYGFSVQQIFDLSRNAISAAFLTALEKKALLKDFEAKFNLWKINSG
jgi:adenosine deaminase